MSSPVEVIASSVVCALDESLKSRLPADLVSQPQVFAIDGPRGSGKSEVLERCRNQINAQVSPTVWSANVDMLATLQATWVPSFLSVVYHVQRHLEQRHQDRPDECSRLYLDILEYHRRRPEQFQLHDNTGSFSRSISYRKVFKTITRWLEEWCRALNAEQIVVGIDHIDLVPIERASELLWSFFGDLCQSRFAFVFAADLELWRRASSSSDYPQFGELQLKLVPPARRFRMPRRLLESVDLERNDRGVHALGELFSALFDDSELRRFLMTLDDGRDILRGLPGTSSIVTSAYLVTEALERRGVIDHALFKALLSARVGRRADVLKVASMFGVTL